MVTNGTRIIKITGSPSTSPGLLDLFGCFVRYRANYRVPRILINVSWGNTKRLFWGFNVVLECSSTIVSRTTVPM